MSEELEKLVVVLDAQMERFRRALKDGENAVGATEKKMKRSVDLLDASFVKLSGAVLAIGFGAMGLEAIKSTDQMNQLAARVRNVAGETARLEAVQAQLYATSQRSGAALLDTTALYQRFALSREALGATNSDLLRITETLQKAAVIGGATQAGMQAATIQLSQSFAAGVVRAEEFNSLVENTPSIVNEIAKGMGKTTGEVRALVLAGKLMARDVFDAILARQAEVDKQFNAMPLNLDQAMNKVGNASLMLLDRLEKKFGLVAAAAKKIGDETDFWFPDLDKQIEQVKSDMLTAADELLTLEERRFKTPKVVMNGYDTHAELDMNIRGLKERLFEAQKLYNELIALQKKEAVDGVGTDTGLKPIDPAVIAAREKYTAAIAKLRTELDLIKATSESERVAIALGVKTDGSDSRYDEIRAVVEAMEAEKAAEAALNDRRREAQALLEKHMPYAERMARLREQQAALLPELTALTGNEAEAVRILAAAYRDMSVEASKAGAAGAYLGTMYAATGREVQKQSEEARRAAEDWGRTLNQSLADAIFHARDFGDILEGISKKLLSIVLFGNDGAGGLLGGSTASLGAGLSGLFGFAGGGRIQPNIPVLVGERGPEVVVPSRSATVMNAADTRGTGAGGVTVHQNLSFDLVPAPTIGAMIENAMPAIIEASKMAVLSSLRRGA